MAELLTSVRLVFYDSSQQVAALDHVVHTIDAFLWRGFSHWSLESAAERGFPRLMDRLLEREWSGFNLQSRVVRYCHGICKALRLSQDVQVLEWWLKRYLPGQDLFPMSVVYEKAIRHGNVPVLEWVYQETNGDLPIEKRCIYSDSPETVAWLLNHGDRLSCNRLSLFRIKDTTPANFDAIKRCLIYQDQNSSFTLVFAEKAVNEVLAYGQLTDLQWLYEHRSTFFGPNDLRKAVRYGNLPAAKWLVHTFPPHYFSNPNQTFEPWFEDLRPYKYCLEMIKWVLCEFVWRKDRKRRDWMRDACDYAARAGKVEMLEFVYKIRLGRCKTEDAIARTFRKWANASPPIMDEAALIGYLDILQFFQRHESQRCTSAAMDNAAAHGLLEVVQWLHENRSEGCSTQAINRAAEHGHLKMVQWLIMNRSEGCTVEAMDLAATNGHLDVVRYLHEYRSEGCTTKAMDSAAKNGHLKVVRFLHENRREGCTGDAVLQAASNGHYSTFEWLYRNRPERLPLNWDYPYRDGYQNILKCQALYGKHDRLQWFVDEFAGRMDFQMVETLLSKSDVKIPILFDVWFRDYTKEEISLERAIAFFVESHSRGNMTHFEL